MMYVQKCQVYHVISNNKKSFIQFISLPPWQLMQVAYVTVMSNLVWILMFTVFSKHESSLSFTQLQKLQSICNQIGRKKFLLTIMKMKTRTFWILVEGDETIIFIEIKENKSENYLIKKNKQFKHIHIYCPSTSVSASARTGTGL